MNAGRRGPSGEFGAAVHPDLVGWTGARRAPTARRFCRRRLGGGSSAGGEPLVAAAATGSHDIVATAHGAEVTVARWSRRVRCSARQPFVHAATERLVAGERPSC